MIRSTKQLVFLLASLVLASARPALSQDSGLSFPELLFLIEKRLNLPPQTNAPLLWRVDRAETTAYGSTRGGPLSVRLSNLQGFINSSQTPAMTQPTTPYLLQQNATTPPSALSAPPATPAQPAQTVLDAGTNKLSTQGQPGFTAASINTPVPLTDDKINKIQSLVKEAQVNKIVPVPNTFPPHFFRVTPAGEPLPVTDYLDSVLSASKNRIFRFNSMPIPVYITPLADASLVRAARESFFDWESRGAKVKFVEVNSEKQARIKVVWSRLGNSSDGNDCTLGAHTITKWTKHPPGQLSIVSISAIPVPIYIPRLGAKYSVPPQVIEVNLDLIYSKMPEQRYLLCKNILAHELGHALGLLGHSPDKGDLMYSVTDEYSRLSQRDLNTLQKLYERKVDVPL
ncbi:MAG: matrixin family metalloprotease [Candidatus Obscuribacter sp.]|jgi:hypothetical protein|nr:matrixin family metalloprotease [Candidatus Obscuribacter sp.]MBL0187857.1 matrixin family metalloprotease [Candidatus Obscuribacter sp.]MBP6348732.1 matrixin family metalloprotease [Candidatus Obscuribacter sp.]MBP6592353.1 matrixin family metalloprotease [Candidatus Obscuribacter sp.]MBP7576272.1 matrixin family metalloprotease [Candidatus Obscuribacter sp.]